MSVVTVLTPHGRRQTVRCQPNQACMHILDEVCRKYTEFRVADYELCHHRRVLDLTQMFRFAGLPNNAQLEMQAATRQRTADQDVTLQLQLAASGRRVQGVFAPDTTVLAIVQQLGGDEVLAAAGGPVRADTVCVYMRTELWGDRLATTTLRSLGLTSGRAAIRVMHKDPDTLRVQANVSAPLVATPVVQSIEEVTTVNKPEESIPLSLAPAIAAHQQHQQPASLEGMDIDDVTAKSQSPSPVDRKKPKMATDNDVEITPNVDIVASNSGVPPAVAKPQSSRSESLSPPPPAVHIIGPRSACVYSLAEAARMRDAQQCASETSADDRFYEVSVNDLKVLLRDLRCQARGQDDQPLLTAKLRELDEAQRTLQRLARYRRTVIRVQFPDRLVLQGAFAAVDRVRDVHEWVRGFLVDEHSDGFVLFTTPPKLTLNSDETLVEANCVPAAVLHFGALSAETAAAATTVLKSEYVAQLSSPEAAVLAATAYRGLNNNSEDDDPNNDDAGAVGGSSAVAMGPPESRRQQQGGQFKASTAQSNVDAEAKLPKWFKPIGK